MKNEVLKYLLIILGAWHFLFRFCPLCNSSAPELYDCPVCEYNKAPKKYWWERFISYLNGDPMVTYRPEKYENKKA